MQVSRQVQKGLKKALRDVRRNAKEASNGGAEVREAPPTAPQEAPPARPPGAKRPPPCAREIRERPPREDVGDVTSMACGHSSELANFCEGESPLASEVAPAPAKRQTLRERLEKLRLVVGSKQDRRTKKDQHPKPTSPQAPKTLYYVTPGPSNPQTWTYNTPNEVNGVD